jgi:hypothetical protein
MCAPLLPCDVIPLGSFIHTNAPPTHFVPTATRLYSKLSSCGLTSVRRPDATQSSSCAHTNLKGTLQRQAANSASDRRWWTYGK